MVILGLYTDNRNENGKLLLRVQGSGFKVWGVHVLSVAEVGGEQQVSLHG